MWHVVSLLIISSIMICRPNILSNAEPLKGVNVRNANRREFPFLVAIERNFEGRGHTDNYECSGTLISERHVLTVSHCIENYLETDLRVSVGCEHLDWCTPYEIDLWETYENWALQNDVDKAFDDGKNDIAIIRLARAVVDRDAEPAILPPKHMILPFRSNVQIAGWGKSNMGYPSILQTATVTLTSQEDCNLKIKKYTTVKPLDEREFCTMADPYVVLGRGDSGGPVIYNGNTILGINEDGFVNIPLRKQINIHININYFRDFIDDVMAKRY